MPPTTHQLRNFISRIDTWLYDQTKIAIPEDHGLVTTVGIPHGANPYDDLKKAGNWATSHSKRLYDVSAGSPFYKRYVERELAGVNKFGGEIFGALNKVPDLDRSLVNAQLRNALAGGWKGQGEILLTKMTAMVNTEGGLEKGFLGDELVPFLRDRRDQASRVLRKAAVYRQSIGTNPGRYLDALLIEVRSMGEAGRWLHGKIPGFGSALTVLLMAGGAFAVYRAVQANG